MVSGLHYTVPWSVPIFALTCLKKPRDVTKFEIMGDENGTVDKIYLVEDGRSSSHVANGNATLPEPFNMVYREKHRDELYRQVTTNWATLLYCIPS
jgi:hypothetical protein